MKVFRTVWYCAVSWKNRWHNKAFSGQSLEGWESCYEKIVYNSFYTMVNVFTFCDENTQKLEKMPFVAAICENICGNHLKKNGFLAVIKNCHYHHHLFTFPMSSNFLLLLNCHVWVVNNTCQQNIALLFPCCWRAAFLRTRGDAILASVAYFRSWIWVKPPLTT